MLEDLPVVEKEAEAGPANTFTQLRTRLNHEHNMARPPGLGKPFELIELERCRVEFLGGTLEIFNSLPSSCWLSISP